MRIRKMTRQASHIMSCLLLLSSITSHAQTSEPMVQLWHAGFMHPNEVMGKTGQQWYGLFETTSGFQLRSVKVTVLDSSNGLQDKYVDVGSKTLPIILLRGMGNIRPGPVKTVFFGNLHLDPGQYVVLDQREGEFHGLGASGKKEGEVLHDYELTFYDSRIKQ